MTLSMVLLVFFLFFWEIDFDTGCTLDYLEYKCFWCHQRNLRFKTSDRLTIASKIYLKKRMNLTFFWVSVIQFHFRVVNCSVWISFSCWLLWYTFCFISISIVKHFTLNTTSEMIITFVQFSYKPCHFVMFSSFVFFFYFSSLCHRRKYIFPLS